MFQSLVYMNILNEVVHFCMVRKEPIDITETY